MRRITGQVAGQAGSDIVFVGLVCVMFVTCRLQKSLRMTTAGIADLSSTVCCCSNLIPAIMLETAPKYTTFGVKFSAEAISMLTTASPRTLLSPFIRQGVRGIAFW